MSAPTTDPTPTSPPPSPSHAEVDPRLLVDELGVKGYAVAFLRRLRGGELGSLPVVVGLVVIWIVFQTQNHHFLGAENLTNLVQQMVATGFLSLGLVLVLLLGEVDLSGGSMFGACGALVATQVANHGTNQLLAIVFALLLGLGLGLVHGFFFSRLGVPAFVVTLAGFLAWAGLQLKILGTTGTANVHDGFIHSLTTYLDHTTGYVVAIVAVALYAGAQVLEYVSRRRAGLRPRPPVEIAFRLVVVAAVFFVSVVVFNRYIGFPLALAVFVLVTLLFDLLVRRTGYGRRVLAVGGNIEAARRAGISVPTIRLTVFMIAGLMAAVGSVYFLSFQQNVDQQTGSATVTLNAIAAVVVGGTSLFGGRGSAWSAVLGALVITSISNGMALLTLPSADQQMVTGAVTLAAVTLDSISRRSQRTSGRV